MMDSEVNKNSATVYIQRDIKIAQTMIELHFNKQTEGLSKNLIFSIPEANIKVYCDLYYAASSVKPKNDPLIDLINYWIQHIDKLEINEVGHFPIDFSDEYIGCLRIERINQEQLQLAYGLSHTYGFGITFNAPGDFYKSVNDFEFDNETIPIIVEKQNLFINLRRIKEELTKNFL